MLFRSALMTVEYLPFVRKLFGECWGLFRVWFRNDLVSHIMGIDSQMAARVHVMSNPFSEVKEK